MRDLLLSDDQPASPLDDSKPRHIYCVDAHRGPERPTNRLLTVRGPDGQVAANNGLSPLGRGRGGLAGAPRWVAARLYLSQNVMTYSANNQRLLSLTNHELFVIAAAHEAQRSGMIVTWLMPATLVADRPRIVAALSVMNYTVDLIRESGRFLAQMLSETQASYVEHFGGQSGRNRDKFAEVPHQPGPDGLPLLTGCCGWMLCEVVKQLDLGDRVIIVGDVLQQHRESDVAPLRKQHAFASLAPDAVERLVAKQDEDGVRDRQLIKHFGEAAQ